MSKAQPYITMFTKGQTFQGKVIAVSNAHQEYQDKLLFPICFRDPASTNQTLSPADGDFHAMEVVPKGSQSILASKIGEPVSFVITSPGRGDQLPWVKLDQQKVECALDEVGKVVLAMDCFKTAADLIINGKATGFKFENIYDLSKRISEHVLTLSKNL
jgi:hypothetical protein